MVNFNVKNAKSMVNLQLMLISVQNVNMSCINNVVMMNQNNIY